MSNNKSSIEFFYEEVWTCFSSNLSWSECELLNKIKEQAKEMEKERMLECYLKADVFPRKYEFEQWYNETYGGNK